MKILIIEDEVKTIDYLKRGLTEQGYSVDAATDGLDGLHLASTGDYDAIILDIMLPGLDGISLLKSLRPSNNTPVIMLTAKGDERDELQGFDLGVDEYITKPFSATYLKIRIKSLLHQRKELQEIYWKAWSEKLNNTQETTLEEKLTPSQPQIISYDEQFMQQVMQVMEEQMENSELTVDEFAQLLNLGRSVFYQKLKSIIGLSPVDFIREIRIKRAVQLIDSGEYNFSQVAYMTGFNDPKYFGKCFKRQMGMTPSEYKENKRDDS